MKAIECQGVHVNSEKHQQVAHKGKDERELTDTR